MVQAAASGPMVCKRKIHGAEVTATEGTIKQDMLRSIVTTRFRDKMATIAFARETQQELLALKEMIEDGRIQPIVVKAFPMERAADAHRHVEMEQCISAIVIENGPLTCDCDAELCAPAHERRLKCSCSFLAGFWILKLLGDRLAAAKIE